ncbi:uncharacterized protein LOC130591069 [Beta vulgaris subsp. vulgaris]|uniref:uncharacterized protein LOC130591069 n=1 Tax=Beta vulgaris subsp. vulgaris TaxID=3555 RepID=UPI0025478BE3|nr:uncharacterized protein LOC130591069 [Beta vulgaris subsp. vulgaris]
MELIGEFAESSRTYSKRNATRGVKAASSDSSLESESNMEQFQQETKSSIYNLETQVGQMSSVMNRLEAQNSGKLPSQTEVNPKKNVSAVTLRSGKELFDHASEKSKVVEEKTRFEDEEVEVLTPSKEVEKVTVPLYAKWLKEMCSIKRKSNVKGKQTVKVSEHVSAVFQKRMPKKCDDPGMFTIPITLGDTKIDRAMLDLGASINRLVEDVLVVVDKLTFPADFYFDGQIIEFNMYDAMRYPNIEDHSLCAIDVFEPCVQGVFDVLRDDDLQSVLDFSLNADSLEFCLPDNVLKIVVELNELSKLPLNPSNYKPMPLTVPSTRPLPSVVQAPDVELKTLPEHLKYVFLGEKETLPVIISNKLTLEQESKLVEVLKEHSTAIGWSIADIHGISPPHVCMDLVGR